MDETIALITLETTENKRGESDEINHYFKVEFNDNNDSTVKLHEKFENKFGLLETTKIDRLEIDGENKKDKIEELLDLMVLRCESYFKHRVINDVTVEVREAGREIKL